jgi:CheY-like chemotaxis protein
MLESLGYTALCVGSGNAALERFHDKISDRGGVVALVLDLTIPGGMGGVETMAEVRKLDKKVPVFVASGYADDQVMKNPTDFGFTASICKPFKKIDLAEMLERHLTVTNIK